MRAEIGYFFSKAQTFDFGYDRSANGFWDLIMGVQYKVYQNIPLAIDIFSSFDFTIPVGKFDQMNGPVVLPNMAPIPFLGILQHQSNSV